MRKKILKVVLKVFMSFLIFFFIFYSKETETFRYEGAERKKKKVDFPKPWYFENGTLRPQPKVPGQGPELWPYESTCDRIINQLMYIPNKEPPIKKKIYLTKMQSTSFKNGSQIFHELNCPVRNCEIVSDATAADAVFFENVVTKTRNNTDQIWIFHSLESPYHSGQAVQESSVNWTASYRLDSDLVTPYDKWVYYDDGNKVAAPKKNYAEGKTKKVAWFVSNCRSNNKRLQYAKALAKYISVDIYGTCGDKVCLKSSVRYCLDMVSKHYKFYLSFENANCRDYITEKFYKNGLRLDVIPIVMGASKEDYEKVAPQNSFIHVEDFHSPKHLAEYLHHLDQNDKKYNSYFFWKGTGEFVNTYFLCRLCAMLHAERRKNYFYKKISHWWRGPGICTKAFWNETNKAKIINSLKYYNKEQ